MGKILVFSASTGGGHNQVAAVLTQEFIQRGHEVERHDFIKEAGRLLEWVIADGYNHLARSASPLFGVIYKTSNQEIINRTITRIQLPFLIHNILRTIIQANPDLIVATHPLAVNVVGHLKAQGKVNSPLVSVVTDFDAHLSYVNPNVDAYIVACRQTAQTLTGRGISPDKIYVYGIPVQRTFWSNAPAAPAREKFTILLMGGLMGAKSLQGVLRSLLQTPYPLRILLVCGNNHRLQAALARKYQRVEGDKEVVIHGFAPDISALMDEADVIFTKPGGITASEAIAKGIPLVIPFFIPGPEEENHRILVENGVAVRVRNDEDMRRVVGEFIQNPLVLQVMKANLREFSSTYSMNQTLALADKIMAEHRRRGESHG